MARSTGLPEVVLDVGNQVDRKRLGRVRVSRTVTERRDPLGKVGHPKPDKRGVVYVVIMGQNTNSFNPVILSLLNG